MVESPRGLVTVALLKTRLDEGHDHLDLFTPLILDALQKLRTPDFLADAVRAVVQERTGILLPAGATQTLLGRCVKRGYLTRQGGRFFRTPKAIPDPALDEARGAIRSAQTQLGRDLVEFGARNGITIATDDDAVAMLATFVSDNKVTLVLDEPVFDSPLDRSTQGRKNTRLVARFITERCFPSPELRSALQALTEGMVLQDTLFLRDIPEATQRFDKLIVAFDTGVLFAAIDMLGAANGVAAREALSLLREAGAKTVAFSPTVGEMRRILAVYEDHLATTEGRLSLYPTPLTHHVLTKRMSPADIRLVSATLEKRLTTLGVSVRELPPHDPRYTLDEKALAGALVAPGGDVESPRIRHDVDCVAGILTLRGGRTATAIERCGAIFCSSAGVVVRNLQVALATQGEHAVPAIVHQVALTSIAWLKKPAAAPQIKMAELAALCAAAMRPTRDTWRKFTETLRKLRAEGAITDDETAAVVASELAEPLLARLDDDFEPDADSIQEAIERVRATYRSEEAAAAGEVVAKAEADAALARRVADEATAKQHDAIAERDNLLSTIRERATERARRLVAPLFVGAVLVTVVAGVLSIPGVFESVGGFAKTAARALVFLAVGFGVYSGIRGASLTSLRDALEARIAERIARRWLPGAEPTNPLRLFPHSDGD